jgi:Uma2 family endonuclease
MGTTTAKTTWTVKDLAGLPDDGSRYEIIEGELFVTRAPHWEHQSVSGLVCQALNVWSNRAARGRAAPAPGVIFGERDAVIPDVVWASTERLGQLMDEAGHLTGAPELAVEVLSEGSADIRRDRSLKRRLYERTGVLEYWIVDWRRREVTVYRRAGEQLVEFGTLGEDEHLTSPILPGFDVMVWSLFE